MRKQLLGLALAVTAALSAAGAALADSPPVQVAGQSAATQQQAVAASSATQVSPSNTNVSIRVLSPGDDGNVTQSNSAASSAQAANQGTTAQTASQAQPGGGIQSSQQSAGTGQLAAALSLAQQYGPSNTNAPVRVLSPGNAGDVTQSNSANSRADAGNTASTTQTGTQSQAGSGCGGCGGGGVQTADQSAETGQAAGALSAAKQVEPSNTAVSIRVLSPGNDGDVTQSNSANSSANAGNAATTQQSSSQTQAGGGCGCTPPVLEAKPAPDCGCSGGTPVQTAKQSAGTGQEAGALSAAEQAGPSNDASPVRVKSYGGGGSVSQSNDAASSATAGNRASTQQAASQNEASGGGIQVAGQDAATLQGTLAGSKAEQWGASNDASPVRVTSPGGGGDVTQSNSAASSARSGNDAGTTQHADQLQAGRSCECGGLGIQALGQKSTTEQGSGAFSEAKQLFPPSRCGCGGASGNDASPVRVGSGGSDGNVDQHNSAASSATSGNRAATDQAGNQQIAGGGLAIQALGQEAGTAQAALAKSKALQLGPSNEASPTRVWSPGGGGSVSQSNDAASSSAAGNDASTTQHGDQHAYGSPCGCGSGPIQVLGQSAWTYQSAHAFSAAEQLWPSNEASPTSVWSHGGSGTTAQSNRSASRGDSGSRAWTGQTASQHG